MGRFHFQTDVGRFAMNELSRLDDALKERANSINSVVSSLEGFSGFGIGDIVNDLRSEIETTNLLGLKAKSGAETLRFVIRSSDNYANIASTIVTAALKAGADAINNVVNEAKNKTDNVQITFENAKHGDVFENGGMKYEVFGCEGKTRLLRTDGAGGIGIFKADGTAYDGYSQRDHYWWNNTPGKAIVDPSIECTSAALATCSTINGIDKIPDEYNDWGGQTQIGGYQRSSEQLTEFCVDNLNKGLSTVIYYNYSGNYGFGHDGHAVTVVGADPNPTSVYDLWVIDPVDGQCKSFREAYGDKGNYFYICYESNPGEYGGAGMKFEDIEQYFAGK